MQTSFVAFLKIVSGIFINIIASLIIGFFAIKSSIILVINLILVITFLLISLKIETAIVEYDRPNRVL